VCFVFGLVTDLVGSLDLDLGGPNVTPQRGGQDEKIAGFKYLDFISERLEAFPEAWMFFA
jgi:hypothetical protein